MTKNARQGDGFFAHDSYLRILMDRGRLVGFWEYDVEEQAIVFQIFGIMDSNLQKAIDETQEYVRDHVGDARSFSLDSPKSRQPKIDALRKSSSERSH